MQYNVVNCTIMQSNVVNCTMMQYNVVYCTIMQYNVLNCTIMQHNVVHSSVMQGKENEQVTESDNVRGGFKKQSSLAKCGKQFSSLSIESILENING